MVVLGTQVEIAEQDRRLAARDDQDHEDEEQKAEHVVRLAVAATVREGAEGERRGKHSQTRT